MNKVVASSKDASHLLLEEVAIRRHLLSVLIDNFEMFGFEAYTTRVHAEKTIPGYEIEPGLSRRSYRILEKEHLTYSTPSALAIEHYGESTPWQCVEMMEATILSAKALGVSTKDIVVRVNNRDLMSAILQEVMGTSPVQTELLVKLFADRRIMESQVFADRIVEVLGAEAQIQIKKLIEIVSMSDLDDEIIPVTAKRGRLYDFTTTVIDELKLLNIGRVVYDPTLANASTFASGLVYSIDVVKGGKTKPLASGGYESKAENSIDLTLGQYISLDGLIEAADFAGVKVPAVSRVELLISFTDVALESSAYNLARSLRIDGVRSQVQYVGLAKEKAPVIAGGELIPFSLIVDSESRRDDVYLLIESKSGSGQELGSGRIVSMVKDYRHSHKRLSEEDQLFYDVLTV